MANFNPIVAQNYGTLQWWNITHAQLPGATEIDVGQIKSWTPMPDRASQLIYYV